MLPTPDPSLRITPFTHTGSYALCISVFTHTTSYHHIRTPLNQECILGAGTMLRTHGLCPEDVDKTIGARRHQQYYQQDIHLTTHPLLDVDLHLLSIRPVKKHLFRHKTSPLCPKERSVVQTERTISESEKSFEPKSECF